MKKSRFAVYFGNRGFFPGSLIASAREEIVGELNQLGHDALTLDVEATRYGAVETVAEGEIFANFLSRHRGEFDGVVLSLPNFGDENGAVAALRDANVPIWVQAYPDDYDLMGPESRRDAFCGKLSIMDVFRQNNIPFTVFKPHTVRPGSARFRQNLDAFDRVCQVVKGVRRMTVGALGARTTTFKTVRIDEVALQKHGITVETFDMSDVFRRMKAVKATGEEFKAKGEALKKMGSWDEVPASAFDRIIRLAVVLDAMVVEAKLDAIAVRCWSELQLEMGISPCVAMGSLNELGLAAACEVDLGNAVAMKALNLASGGPVGLLDWNNNYYDEDDKCILFHCGPLPASMMERKGRITDHSILMTTIGEGKAYGCNQGRIRPMDFTFTSLMTDEGRVKMYLGDGKFTADPIPADFFGVAGVAEIRGLQDVLLHIGQTGHRHHVSVTEGIHVEPLREALGHYLGFDISLPQQERHE